MRNEISLNETNVLKRTLAECGVEMTEDEPIEGVLRFHARDPAPFHSHRNL